MRNAFRFVMATKIVRIIAVPVPRNCETRNGSPISSRTTLDTVPFIAQQVAAAK
jgi:hypothetical protein